MKDHSSNPDENINLQTINNEHFSIKKTKWGMYLKMCYYNLLNAVCKQSGDIMRVSDTGRFFQ